MSPVMAAAAALTGRLTDVRKVAHWNTTPAKASPKLDVAPEIADIESDEELERIEDLPEDGAQTGTEDSKRPSAGMPPFTNLCGIGKLISACGFGTILILFSGTAGAIQC